MIEGLEKGKEFDDDGKLKLYLKKNKFYLFLKVKIK